jgi:NADPH2:quinone reductase
MLKNAVLRYVLVYDMPETAKQAAIEALTPMLDGGTLHHQVGVVVPLERVVDSHRAVEESSVVGCVVVGTDS